MDQSQISKFCDKKTECQFKELKSTDQSEHQVHSAYFPLRKKIDLVGS